MIRPGSTKGIKDRINEYLHQSDVGAVPHEELLTHLLSMEDISAPCVVDRTLDKMITDFDVIVFEHDGEKYVGWSE